MASNLRRSKRTVGKRISYLESRLKATRMTPIPRRLSPSAVAPKNLQAGAVTAIAIAPGSITNGALAVGVGGATTAYSGTAPSSPSVGDVWFDSSDSLKLKRYDGTNWVSMQDLGIAAAAAGATAAATAATAAQTTANGKNKVFYAASAPTAVSVGDLWFDTAQENKLSKWNGSAWEAFGLGNAAFSNIDAGKITAGTIAAGRITSASISAAEITAAQITSGTISSARITSASISAADVNADRITAGTITGRAIVGGTVTTGTWNATGASTGLKLDSAGYITGSGGGVKIRNYGTDGTDGATGTLLFGDSITTGSMSLDSISITPNGTDEVNIDPSGTAFDIEVTTGGIQVANGKTISATTAFYTSGSSTAARMMTSGGIQYLTGGSSSRHLKENIKDLEDSIGILKTLKPKVYNFKVDAFQDNDPITGEPWTEEARQLANFDIKYGLILEDVLEVRPELISYTHEKTEIPYDQEGGYADISSWKPQMWEEADVLVLCVKAIQELSAKVDLLEARIQTLEGA